MKSWENIMGKCIICPRRCGADRQNMEKGVCGVTGGGIYVARSSLHMWEEPCISGKRGSGTIFFSGCSLRCVYCQNYEISRGMTGKEVTVDELADICIRLQHEGAHNINLVTPTHYAYAIREAVLRAKKKGLVIPVVYNSSGYENAEVIRQIADVIDIYLVDFKYMHGDTAMRYSKAKDYPDAAKKALAVMADAAGEAVFDEDGMMQRGVIVRYLLLPGHVREGKEIIKYLYDTYGNAVFMSLMNQYTPVADLSDYPEINRRVTEREYERLVDYAISIGVENAFIQEGGTASESFIPDFK